MKTQTESKIGWIAPLTLLALSSVAEAKNCTVTNGEQEIGRIEATEKFDHLVLDDSNPDKRTAFVCNSELIPGYGTMPRVICGFGYFVPDESDPKRMRFDALTWATGMGALIQEIGDFKVTCF